MGTKDTAKKSVERKRLKWNADICDRVLGEHVRRNLRLITQLWMHDMQNIRLGYYAAASDSKGETLLV